MPRVLLRLEGLVYFMASLVMLWTLDLSWKTYLLLLLLPDLSMLAYFLGNKVGAVVYNLCHTLIFPATLFLWLLWQNHLHALIYVLAWLGHIGLDRALGFGLKYPTGFKDTHLQKV